MGNGTIDNTTGLPTNPTEAWENKPLQDKISVLNLINNFNNTRENCMQ